MGKEEEEERDIFGFGFSAVVKSCCIVQLSFNMRE